jgi:hypothetical protein
VVVHSLYFVQVTIVMADAKNLVDAKNLADTKNLAHPKY